jgi:uncharacterized phage-associated protein
LRNIAYNEGMRLRFNEAKATQAAAQMLKLANGSMNYMKLIKLLYLADREALARWGRSISTDRHVSMDKGPVLSRVLNLINEGSEDAWGKHISEPCAYEVKLVSDPGVEELSRAEEALLAEVFEAHGHKNQWRLVKELHDLPEWQDPEGSMIPITVRDILQALGKTPAEIAATEEEMESRSFAEALLQPL